MGTAGSLPGGEVSMLRMEELHLNSPIRFHGMGLNLLSTGTTLSLLLLVENPIEIQLGIFSFLSSYNLKQKIKLHPFLRMIHFEKYSICVTGVNT
jgi:hypothetical protein